MSPGNKHLSPSLGKGSRRTLVLCVALASLVLLVYAPVREHAFVSLDDPLYILDNDIVQRGLTAEGVRWAFTNTETANWHPLAWLSHMLDCELFGLDPGGHHLTSAVLHAVNAALLFLALRLMTSAFWPSVIVAALFALHPLRVESVAWAAERKDVLSGLFFMLTLWLYGRYAKRPGAVRYALVFVSVALGLMSKPTLVTLPLLLLLLDVWPLGRWGVARGTAGSRIRLVLEKLPLLGLSAALSIVTLTFQKGTGAVMSLENLTPGLRSANALVAYGTYLWKTIWPVGLACFYPHPVAVSTNLTGSLIVPAIIIGLLLAGVTVLVVLSLRKRPFLAVGWFWYLGTLVPVIGLVQVGEQALADRYTYLPLIGIYIAAVWGVAGWVSRPSRRAVVAVVSVGLLAVAAAVTRTQVAVWRSSETLFAHAARVTDDNYLAYHGLGAAVAGDGRFDEAAGHYRRALEVMPNFADAHNNLGVALAVEGALEEAAEHYRRALALRPEYVSALFNLGALLERLGDLDAATERYRQVLEIAPDHVEASYNLALLRARQGDHAAAATYLEQVIRIRPQMAGAHLNLGIVLDRGNTVDRAVEHLEQALRLDGSLAVAHHRLALIAARRGDLSRAATRFEAALKIDPGYAEAHNNLGIVHARQEDYEAAVRHFESALRIDPDYAEARRNLELARVAWVDGS